jgi:hypothetical protein
VFRVRWQPDALDQLAAVCVDHPDRWTDIDAAEHDAHYRLRINPIHFSQPIAEELRRITSYPLVIYFSLTGNTIFVEGVGWLD